ncbi:hypothetical protein GUITHDRAFT_155854 [Guillardia theta CCMP2712]|uniref:Uncharacterized protein n=1 Tax=Guillardia theta (strain CCMP2712) TaxID=905079 RepID=L1ICR3_GUITC|nr:hypothetical protein GUITHDRAFT_155854 [Guillardia theta CCMP2712]EKX34041.1 hypothetical protein GUITHDRAFT_155854 [Guillardia theta CCMP2712]|eukprot:XP_005821021.1 hypothetical protein GUITHDRAFT_155854 [Guillardia theta CCMP2712]
MISNDKSMQSQMKLQASNFSGDISLAGEGPSVLKRFKPDTTPRARGVDQDRVLTDSSRSSLSASSSCVSPISCPSLSSIITSNRSSSPLWSMPSGTGEQKLESVHSFSDVNNDLGVGVSHIRQREGAGVSDPFQPASSKAGGEEVGKEGSDAPAVDPEVDDSDLTMGPGDPWTFSASSFTSRTSENKRRYEPF